MQLLSADRLRAEVDRFNRLDLRVRLASGAVAALVIVGAVFGLTRGSSGAVVVSAVPTATIVPTETPVRVRATPPGTPAPRPATFVGISASVPVPSSIPKAPRPTASPEPGLWRLEGYVIDDAGQPIENVCVVVGPVGCQPYSPHTDERGHYFFDIAATNNATIQTNYDFYFEIPGHQTVWLRMVPQGSTTFNAVLKRT